MGDGGVACMPLQHSNIMEDRFTAPPPAPPSNAASSTVMQLCSEDKGNSNNSNDNEARNVSSNNSNGKDVKNVSNSNGVVSTKPKRIVKKVIKVKKIVAVKKEGSGKGKLVEKGAKSGSGKEVVVQNGKGSVDSKAAAAQSTSKQDEVEEGELGTLKWPPPKAEVENGEFVRPEKLPRKGEIEKGEIVSEKWRKGDEEKGEIAPEKWRKGDFAREDIEKGEIIPERWNGKEEHGFSKSRGRYDLSRERTPPSGKYSVEDALRRKEFSRSGSSQHSKSSLRWETGQDRNIRISLKNVDEEGSYKSEYGNGKSHGKEHSSVKRLKRHGADSDSSERKHYGDYGDYAAFKSRRLSEDSARSGYPEHYSRHSVDRFHRNSSLSRISSMDKYSSRHHEPALSSKVVYDRHARSPGHSEWSPGDRSRYYDHRDCSPFYHERTPYGRERSPYGRERSPFSRERSPYGFERSPYGRERSPYGLEKSPYTRERSPYSGEKSSYGREKSPYDRSRHHDHRYRSPTNSERSSQDQARYHERRDRTPNYQERSPLDRGKPYSHREASRKGGAGEKRSTSHGSKGQQDKLSHKDSNGEKRSVPHGSKGEQDKLSHKDCNVEKRSTLHGSKGQQDKLSHKDSNVKDPQLLVKDPQDRSSEQNLGVSDENTTNCESQKEEQSQSLSTKGQESIQADGAPPEELQSMEEDMDICDTPPHVPVLADISTGKWLYFDYFGMECGPSKLSGLRTLVDEGVLVSDHFIKHLDSDRWVTIENAVSPLVTANFPSIVSDAITQLVSPPEAPGNLLVDSGDTMQFGTQNGKEALVTLPQPVVLPDDSTAASEPCENLRIDERVGTLLDGHAVVPGRELETIGEVLQMTFENGQLEEWGKSEGITWPHAAVAEQNCQSIDEQLGYSEMETKEGVEVGSGVNPHKDNGLSYFDDSADWFSGRWSCKGGDWMRNDEAVQERCSRRKLVLNDGFPLCQMPKSGSEDPRWHRKDELYNPSQSRKLDLPPWAFSCSDDRNEAANRSTLTKPPLARGLKGTMLSVVRINACVVMDHGSIVSETPRAKVRGKDRYSSRSGRSYSTINDMKRSTAEGDSRSRTDNGHDLNVSWKSIASIGAPKDRLCTVDDLQLHLGEWYYLDGSGHEQGPFSLSELQVLANQGTIKNSSSIFRKFDRIWVPVTCAPETSEATAKNQLVNVSLSGDSLQSLSKSQNISKNDSYKNSHSFHSLHPQFIGYTRGKLHALVMKSYKSREFAAAINEVLDPWISARQPKKEIDKHVYRKSEIDGRAGKRARMQVDESDEDYMEEDWQLVQKDETSFEELCGDASFVRKESAYSGTEMGSWGFLDGHVLARIFHFMRTDIKSLVYASLTCKHWRAAVSFYKDISRQVDLSSVALNCNDSMVWNIMNGYNKEKINSLVLVGCTDITSGMLEEILLTFPCLSSIDIRGCSQFMDLSLRFPKVNWLKSRSLREDSHFKIRSLKQIGEKIPSSKGLGNETDDFGELKEYFDSVNKRDSANQLFRRSLYKRSKLFDARRSSSILSRDARTRRWAIKKSESGYRRMEGFLASGLKDIMKENTFDFFVPKVAEIEERMKKGYYLGRGLRSVKEDISRMCRDAIKSKNRGGGDMNRIITLFLQLASHLEESSKFSYERDDLMKSWKDDLSAGLGYASMKYKKKLVSERKYRSNGSSFSNGSIDNGDYVSDQEIRKRISRLNRKSMDSGSETSDDANRSSEDGRSGSESTVSDTESDLDFSRTGESRGDGYFTADEGLYSMADEREWGARMTKVSLVPPVTRKYEVIGQYVIVADEEDVQRKMCVSLPDDYAEKLDAQKNGTEELDMELPEVKDFKPRKQLGNEVIEQEVYGIDPYTHNLLLDSMPDELDWPLLEKHLFIEDVLLRTLNKQVRHFTGTGNTPMMYHLQPVIEEIERAAEEDCDIRMMKMCRGILRAIDSRPDDNYVAYRKGLGVVCNKVGGFGEDDFVVEFLGEVYPAWKWFEKQDGIRSLQKDSKDPAPEFYNIYLERPKGDADGYDLVVVDAMHKANYASRICHSCRPNCEAKVTAVNGQYQIGIYAVRGIQDGEEITFDYNSVTESKEEYEASVCLCGSQVCRGSYLNLTGEGAFQKVLKQWHGILDRHHLMLEACELNSVSEEDFLDLGRAGLGSCLLGGLPDWVVAYSARLVRFINLERTKLPEEILKHNLEEKRKYFSDICLDVEKSDAEVQAEGVYNQRLQNLAVTLDKVRYVMRCVFGDPKKAPPPLEKLSPEETVSFLWRGDGSLVEELLQCMAPYVDANVLNDLKSKIRAHDPLNSDDICKELQKSLLWLRDEVRSLPCTHKCRHDAAADLIHIYAYTKCFFRVREYGTFTSPPVYISPLDLGPKHADKLGAGIHEYRKAYGENYCLGQLIFWHIQTNAEPDCSLIKASRGCLSLPDIGSFYAKVQKPSQQRIYGPKTLKMMLERMEKYSQKPWPKDHIWSFKTSPKVFGSPMFDTVLNNSPLDREMLHWLRHRPTIYQAMWDR